MIDYYTLYNNLMKRRNSFIPNLICSSYIQFVYWSKYRYIRKSIFILKIYNFYIHHELHTKYCK